jgi:DNA-binding LacI/PurR family transcriptional regulator
VSRATCRTRAAAKGGRRVIGFDDSPLALRIEPALTTVRQDIGEKGRMAAATLLATIERARTDRKSRARHLRLPTELVVRDSSGPAPR